MDNSSQNAARYVVGIDIGSGSARAGVFDLRGQLMGSAKRDISLFLEGGNIAEQSSEDIWQAVCLCVRQAVAASHIDPSSVAGIGVDATCSLVVIGTDGQPLPVGDPARPERNIIVWMDHRAIEQARRINATGHEVLRYVGNRISPEMETPKLLWLKENRPEVFHKAAHFFDLTDYITWRASGSLDRSICTTTCKWTYLAHERRWDDSYFAAIGLPELSGEGHARIGTNIVDAGTALGRGLTEKAAGELGLLPRTAVAAGLIDAHAGGIGTIGAPSDGGNGTVTSRMAYVFGTSACTLTSTVEPGFVPGVWGPYYSAMVPGLWLNEAGQSAAGAAIDHLVSLHPAAASAKALAREAGMGVAAWLALQAAPAGSDLSELARLVDRLHVVPEFLGNRAPFADPDARAVIAGLDLSQSIESLVRLYIAGVCGIGYGLRQIIAAQRRNGVDVDTVVISGGAGQSALVRQLLADAAAIRIAAPVAEEPVLLGAAMLGAVAAGCHKNVAQAMSAMSQIGTLYSPKEGSLHDWHNKRFAAFELLQTTARSLLNS